ncbi:SAM-dependent methyltransferase [Opitutus sp. ER46]|uniref:SAM-dependent methyltransferase n=1 Tax=Opitutus sp. ER46 TaxID=2161864 RepID=UPI000D321352|nr:SAM-dependent methyltransferase [Opitutus sp. ER46]PTX92638.1 hypothetical protein DB354_15040 [Opitutus sp. ER46]
MPPSSDAFLAAFAERADANLAMRFDAFVDLALYHPKLGYYAQSRPRVGYGPGTDFFTASTSGPVFGELVTAAVVQLLGSLDVAEHAFVEIGAETPGGVLTDVAHPFRAVRTIPLGGTLEISGPCVVFSNELFDAQPFRRFRFREGQWHELGVGLHAGGLQEIDLGPADPDACGTPLLTALVNGYTIDAPVAAAQLAGIIARQPWTGLFVAFDYGKSWRELTEATPAGTARAYVRHTQSNDLLAQPGQQDLTCHVCWDWLSSTLEHNGFSKPQLESQEAFFIRHAEKYLAAAIAADAAHFTRRKQSLLQLLHGTHLGQKFQVLHALRSARGA